MHVYIRNTYEIIDCYNIYLGTYVIMNGES